MKISKKIINISLWSISLIVLVTLLGFSSHKQREQLCNGLIIKIADQTGNFFIEPQDIVDVLNSKGSKVKDSPMKNINLTELERIIYTNPFVARVEVYTTIDGFVNIDIWQRNPLVRVVNTENEHFYIDDNGEYMPVTDKFTSHVVVASGFVNDRPIQNGFLGALPSEITALEKPIILQLNEVALFLRNHPFWDAQVEQIYVNENSELELIPRVGNHRIVLGDSEHLSLKMKNLMTFYTDGLTKVGWEKYSVINLKYLNQVICTKANYKSNS